MLARLGTRVLDPDGRSRWAWWETCLGLAASGIWNLALLVFLRPFRYFLAGPTRHLSSCMTCGHSTNISTTTGLVISPPCSPPPSSMDEQTQRASSGIPKLGFRFPKPSRLSTTPRANQSFRGARLALLVNIFTPVTRLTRPVRIACWHCTQIPSAER